MSSSDAYNKHTFGQNRKVLIVQSIVLTDLSPAYQRNWPFALFSIAHPDALYPVLGTTLKGGKKDVKLAKVYWNAIKSDLRSRNHDLQEKARRRED